MSKFFKADVVVAKVGSEEIKLQCKRVYIQAAPVNAFRELMSNLPGVAEADEQVGEFIDIYASIEELEKEGKKTGKTDEEIGAEILAAIGHDDMNRIYAVANRKQRIEAQNATAIFEAKLNILAPALRGWDIEDDELKLPEGDDAKKALLQKYGEIGQAVVDAMWEWYRPTTASSAAGSEKTPKADTTTSHSSTPATESSDAAPPNSSITK